MASEPWVKCESCTVFVPPSDLHPCGPGGRWRYCTRCFAHTETWPETKDTSRTSKQMGVSAEDVRDAVSWLARNAHGMDMGKWQDVSSTLLRAAEALSSLRAEAERQSSPETPAPHIWSARFECSECKALHTVSCSQPYFKVFEFQCLRCRAITQTDRVFSEKTSSPQPVVPDDVAAKAENPPGCGQ